MPKCPMCSKELAQLARRCPTCKADLDLLVDYSSFLQGGVERAENLTRSGELGEAVWAYLEVLSIDPDNPTARRQVSKVATAVRQFDQSQARFSLNGSSHGGDATTERLQFWVRTLAAALALVVVSFSSFFVGYNMNAGAPGSGVPTSNSEENRLLPAIERPRDTLGN